MPVTVKDYVTSHGGNKVIESILIANNGIAAVKCIRSLRKWAYETFGNERAIRFVVMATPEDLRVNAEYIRMADQIAEVPGGRNSNNYANVDLIVDIAERMGVDGVWAGWGHASENPRLPEALSKTDIAFLGPPAGPMRDLGDKIASTLVAQSADVSCVPWNGEGITIDYEKDGIREDVYKKATVQTLEEAHKVIERIGFPVMIKASEGGGGKGIRKVTETSEIDSAFRQVQGEVPGSPIFIMKMINRGRHLEVQILGDQYREAIALYGRECSVQRRHQKIIEEGPAIIAPPKVWEEMERAAVRITKAVGYVGVGTVEYLFEESTSHYYFLELNPRLQVEHPVTELITNVNLVAAQLQVAMGIPLHRLPDIRRLYAEDPLRDSVIAFDTAQRLPPKGHVIAVRITGENPYEGFKPTSGGIQELTFRSNSKVWGYFSVGALGGLHEFADSQFGHIFAHGETREDTRKELAIALRELSIRGEISTPIEYVRQLLETDVFLNNQVNTQWLDGLISSKAPMKALLDPWLVVLCGAAFTAHSLATERMGQYSAYLDRGQNPPRDLIQISDEFDLIYLNIKYPLRVTRSGPLTYVIALQGQSGSVATEVRPLGNSGLFIFVDGKSHVCYGQDTTTGLKLMIDANTCQFSTEYDPTQLRTSTAGKYLVENGAHVPANTPYAEMEVMKMYLPMLTSEAGKISHVKGEGSVLEAGEVIATVQLDDPQTVQRATVFQGAMPSLSPPHVPGEKVHQLLREALTRVQNTLAGYHNDQINQMVDDLLTRLLDPSLPVWEVRECISQLKGRIPRELEDSIEAELRQYREQLTDGKNPTFSGKSLQALIDRHAASLPTARQKEFLLSVDSVVQVAKKFADGLLGQAETEVASLLGKYLEVEELYRRHRSREQLLALLRPLYKTNHKGIWEVEVSHANLVQKNKVIVHLLDRAQQKGIKVDNLTALLKALTALEGNHHSVVLKAKQLLSFLHRPSFQQRYAAMETSLQGDLEPLITQPYPLFDTLTSFFYHSSPALRAAAVEAYVRRAYRAYEVLEYTVPQDTKGVFCATWIYSPPSGKPGKSDKATLLREQSDTPLLKRIMTDDNLNSFDPSEEEREGENNRGIVALFSSEEEFLSRFDEMLQQWNAAGLLSKKLRNILKVVFPAAPTVRDEEEIAKFSAFLKNRKTELRTAHIKRVTVLLTRPQDFPFYYTFRERLGYEEHTIYRHIEPPLAYHLELSRMTNFKVELWPTENQQIHLYYAQENTSPSTYSRFFARAVIRGGHYERTTSASPSYLISDTEGLVAEAENVLSEACAALEVAATDPRFEAVWNNHIFMKFVPEVAFDPEEVVPIIETLARKYSKRLSDLRVGEVELVGKLKGPHPNARFIITNPTTFQFNVDAYAEVKDLKTKRICLTSLFGSRKLEGKDVLEPYSLPLAIEKKRHQAHQQLTSYVYDFIPLLETALLKNWESFLERNKGAKLPRQGIVVKELILNNSGGLDEISRPAGQNTIGMVAWRVILFTPEYPEGRSLILIANDITFQIGSFGVPEDELFYRASQLARKEGIPRIYVAANSGARIGLAKEVKDAFHIEWVDPDHPEKGFKHFYIPEKECQKLIERGSLKAEKAENGKCRITDIIGEEDGLGAENLKGSGLIAGETSLAYEETFTLTLVTGRTVGIGSYLVRLGQRTIQHKGPIILTGAGALNKVLGRKVYSSNGQLGGPQIMGANGISHLLANDELDSIDKLITWLSYVPAKQGAPLPVLPIIDPVDRRVAFTPTKLPYDPRHMLAGVDEPSGEWTSGFLDRYSFTETLGGWGKTVVTGRGRLGGIPVGVIAVETRTVERVIPADPAVVDSREDVKSQAGQVWYPDSAYKTAQAIRDFDRGEDLPLILFANWRGFAGGLRDLFDEILKFGSFIVDNLRQYRQPVFVYIPPFAELRGGAWVVVDPSINSAMMEMYADPHARGGVLEPPGTVEIKYKTADILKTMHRLDSQLLDLDSQLPKLSGEEREKVLKSIQQRETALMPLYSQVAIAFADLQDTPGRMVAKNVIRQVIPWETSRHYFYLRLRRRLAEESHIRKFMEINPTLSHARAMDLLKEAWTGGDWNNDTAVTEWLSREDAVTHILKKLKTSRAKDLILGALGMDEEGALESFAAALRSSAELRSAFEKLK